MSKVYEATDVGCVRPINEDSAAVFDPEVYVVADGMGGHAAGEVASHILVKAVRDDLADCGSIEEQALCRAIRKDSGDDPDVTHDTLVFAAVQRTETPGVTIDGGAGVGRVTKRGLDQPVGAAAINSVPRRGRPRLKSPTSSPSPPKRLRNGVSVTSPSRCGRWWQARRWWGCWWRWWPGV